MKQLEEDTLGPFLKQDFYDYAEECQRKGTRPNVEHFFTNIIVPENAHSRFVWSFSKIFNVYNH